MSVRLLTIPEAAERLRISIQRAYALARNGLIPAVYLGRQIRVDEEALEEFVRRGGSRSLQVEQELGRLDDDS